mgnify:FL=1
MRHQKRVKKLGRTASHRKALMRNMAASLLKYERIETTIQKAKVLRSYIEPIITTAKKANDTGDVSKILHLKREVLKKIKDRAIIVKLFEEIALRYMNRPGGYTRIYKLGSRAGDNATMALIELVEEKLDTTVPKKSDATKTAKTKMGANEKKQKTKVEKEKPAVEEETKTDESK